MKRMTRKVLLDLVEYDPETGLMTWAVPRHGCIVGNEIGTTTRLGYRNVYLAGYRYMVHRLAWLYMYGNWPDGQIDHINGNGLDNRISNLRVATPSQNQANKGMRRDNSSGVKGVTWDASRDKWSAGIQVGGKRINLGRYASLDEAAEAYASAARIYFSDFSNPVRT